MRENSRAKAAPARAGRGRYLPLAALLLALAALLGFLLVGRVRVRRWIVEAPAGIDAEALRLSLEKAHSGASMIFLDAKHLAEELSADPLVSEAKVEKRFPDAVAVSLKGRKAVMAALCRVGGKDRVALLDAEGVAFGMDPESARADLPVLSGIRFENPSPGSRLPPELAPVLESMAALEESGSALAAAISEVRYVRKPGAEPECLVYTMGSRVPVRIRTRITEDALRSAALVLDVMRKRGLEGRVREIDLRTGAIVYKAKEGGV